MDKRDMAAQAERYKREMMKLYGKSTVIPERVNHAPITEEAVPAVNVLPEEDEPPVAEEAEREIQTEVDSADLPGNPEDIEKRYPEPDLSELTTNFQENREDESGQKLGAYLDDMEYNGKGVIVVNVRAGDQADPIENAVVHISSINDGNRFYNATGVTDNSGTTQRFIVPTPSLSYSQTPDSRVRPYALYDISVTAKGFFNARSVDVPVFEGITSVQNFSMVPLPLYMNANEETVTYYNQEPNL